MILHLYLYSEFIASTVAHNTTEVNIDGLVQDCSNFIANALELLQSCTKPSIYLSLNKMTDILQRFSNRFYFEKVLSVDSNLVDISYQNSTCQYASDYLSFGPDNCLSQNRRQAIIWTYMLTDVTDA